jgi:large subunit ribosomal protein L18
MIIKRKSTAAKKRVAIRHRSGDRTIEVSVRKTDKHFYGVVYDCTTKMILFSCSTLKFEKGVKTWDKNAAKLVGLEVAAKLKEKNITEVFFNKLSYKYHGKLVEFVESLRTSGIAI